jgi:hypothetical protein
MTPAEMRVQLKQAYPSSKGWAARVDQMTDNKLYAILMRLNMRKKTAA